MSYTAKQREYYNHDRKLVCEALNITVNQYNAFRRIGSALHAIYENDCNGLYSDEEEYNKNTAPLYEKADKMAKDLGLFIYYQTDPRGATIYLDTKEIPDNNYNRAHCIY